MANPKLTGGTNELQERYANSIVALKRKENVVTQWFRRDYEGDPKAGAVKIPTRNTEVTVADYNVVDGVSLTTSATTYTTVTIGKDKAVNELIDGYESQAVPDNIVAQRIDSAGYALGHQEELDGIGTLEDGGTEESSVTALTTSNAYTTILNMVKRVHKLGVPFSEIKVAINDDTWELLLTDSKFSNTAGMLGEQLIRDGVVGKIGGAEVKVSSNMRDVEYDGSTYDVTTEVIVFSPLWAQKVEEWRIMPTINDLKDGTHIGSSALQGRYIYQPALLDSTTCRVKTTKVSHA